MEWSQAVSRYRRPIERSVSEHKSQVDRFPEEFHFHKGQNLRKENSYQGTCRGFFRADNSLIINLRRLTHASFSSFIIRFITPRNGLHCERFASRRQDPQSQWDRPQNQGRAASTASKKVCTTSAYVHAVINAECRLRFRYFCIFCKMDFLSADDFLDHLEMHPNGSFVLVKRDLPQPTPAPSEPPESEEAEEEHSPILPEALRDQIKVRAGVAQLLEWILSRFRFRLSQSARTRTTTKITK